MAGAQNVIIRGKAIDYAGKEISFYTFTDPVVHQKQELTVTKINKDGTFTASLHPDKTIEIYTDLEKYTGTIVIEPGKEYPVTLPPFSLRNSIEAKSPYFQPTLYWLGLPQTDQNDLNFLIRSFMTDYNEEVIQNTSAIYKNRSIETVNNIIQHLEQKYGANKNDYFNTLKKYYYADLENIVNPGKPDYIIDKYFKKEPVKLSNPAYQKVFRIIFNDFLKKESLNIKNRSIINLINSGDFAGLVSYFGKKGYQKEIAELIIIKGLYDSYYTGGFSKDKIIKMIDQAQDILSSELIPINKIVRRKLTSLTIKSKAPDFKLNDLNNELISLDKYRGKFLYLNFIRSNSSECRAEMDSLKFLEKKFRQVLAVVSISTDENFETSAKLWKEKGYSWDLLNGSGKKQLIENYKAEVVPVFYLLDPDGNLILSPAPPPSHEFEPIFIKLFRESKFKR